MKIGFIDYFLDEFHANHYPAWLREASGGEMEVLYAFAEIDSPRGGLTTDQWCAAHAIQRISAIEEIVEKSDALVVLSPDNPERHEALCQLPLQSGKRVYVDKTFADTGEAARRLFALAKAHGTPCYSASALRFAEEYRGIDASRVENIGSWGPGPLGGYSVHQIEPVVALMGPDASRVRSIGTEKWPAYVCAFRDGRQAVFSHHGEGCPFGMAVDYADGRMKHIAVTSSLFTGFIAELVDFFRTGEVKAPHAETIAIMAIREAALKAAQAPGQWVRANA